MADSTLTLEQVIAEVQKLDPSLTKEHRYFKTAVFMMAAFKGVGQSDVALHKFTGFSRGFLIRRIKNLKRSGIWGNGEFHHRWFEDDIGPIEFRLDVKTAEGELDEDSDLKPTAAHPDL
jgi:hypothetical protein